MIEYSLRLVAASLKSVHKPRIGFFDESVLPLLVWPSDLDSFGHMNNGRYLTVMDLGRNDWLVRTGMAMIWLQRRWSPALGGATIRYLRPLRALRRYQLHSRMLCWDDKWFYFEQRFTRDDKLYAVAMVKGLLLDRGTKVPPEELAAAVGQPRQSPPMPEAILRWTEAESSMMAR